MIQQLAPLPKNGRSLFSNSFPLLSRVFAKDGNLSVVIMQNAENRFDGRGFSRTIRSDESDLFALLYRKRKGIECFEL
jgi:hypothetical protein